MNTQTTYTMVWTKKAVGQYRRQLTFEPRHTVSNYPANLESPWLADDMKRKCNGAPWILIEAATGHIVKGSADYLYC